MARIKCKKCGKRFGSTLKQCPDCSAQVHSTIALKRWCILVLPFLCLTVWGSVYFANEPLKLVSENTKYNVPTLQQLLSMSPAELAKQDIAVINLACAEDLYGAEKLDVKACLQQLDEWAHEALILTRDKEFVFKQTPGRWNHSINKWKCDILAQYLSKIIGLTYNQALKNNGPKHIYDTSYFKDSKDFLIHGLILEKNRGTCASMPVLFTAIAQRMGYPVKLATTHSHLFSRWADPENEEIFNIEVTDTYPEFKSDEFYKSWPRSLSLEEIDRNGYLESLTPQRELSAFLHLRGMCLWDQDKLKEAREAFMASIRLDPEHKPRNFLHETENCILAKQMNRSGKTAFLPIDKQKEFLNNLNTKGN